MKPPPTPQGRRTSFDYYSTFSRPGSGSGEREAEHQVPPRAEDICCSRSRVSLGKRQSHKKKSTSAYEWLRAVSTSKKSRCSQANIQCSGATVRCKCDAIGANRRSLRYDARDEGLGLVGKGHAPPHYTLRQTILNAVPRKSGDFCFCVRT